MYSNLEHILELNTFLNTCSAIVLEHRIYLRTLCLFSFLIPVSKCVDIVKASVHVVNTSIHIVNASVHIVNGGVPLRLLPSFSGSLRGISVIKLTLKNGHLYPVIKAKHLI